MLENVRMVRELLACTALEGCVESSLLLFRSEFDFDAILRWGVSNDHHCRVTEVQSAQVRVSFIEQSHNKSARAWCDGLLHILDEQFPEVDLVALLSPSVIGFEHPAT